MPAGEYEARLVFDENFYEKVIKEDPKLLKKLMYINVRAKGHKRCFNVLPKFIFDRLLNQGAERCVLRCSFYDLTVEEIEELEDEMEKLIKYAIHILEESPYKSYILTSDDKVDEYKKNPHYSPVRDISVKGKDEAIAIIEDFYQRAIDN